MAYVHESFIYFINLSFSISTLPQGRMASAFFPSASTQSYLHFSEYLMPFNMYVFVPKLFLLRQSVFFFSLICPLLLTSVSLCETSESTRTTAKIIPYYLLSSYSSYNQVLIFHLSSYSLPFRYIYSLLLHSEFLWVGYDLFFVASLVLSTAWVILFFFFPFFPHINE